MGYGTELIFALDRPTIHKYLQDGTAIPRDPAALEAFYEYDAVESIDPAIQTLLAAVHEQLVKQHIDPNAQFVTRSFGPPSLQVTHAKLTKPHVLTPFAIESFGDEEGPRTLGITLFSRYFPTWVDWREPHGGSGNPIILDAETLRMVELARNAIAPILPEIVDAPLAAVLVHY